MFRLYRVLISGIFALCLAGILAGMLIGARRPQQQILIAGAQLTLVDASMPQAPSYALPVEYGSLPAWSPDGESLAVIDPTSRRLSIFSANLRQRRDFPIDFLIQLPVWSPDGEWIAVTAYPTMNAYGSPRSNDADVWLVAVDGSAPSNLSRTNNLREQVCRPSSDGIWLACQGLIDDRTTQFYVMKLADGRPMFLPAMLEAGGIAWFGWRPGTHEVYASAWNRLFVYDTDTGAITRYQTRDPLDVPALSPDGQSLAAIVWQNAAVLQVFDLQGRARQSIPIGAVSDVGSVQWSPDGTLIAVSTLTREHLSNSTLYRVDVATGEVSLIYSDLAGSSLFFQWRPATGPMNG